MALTDAVADDPLYFQPGLSTTAGWFRLWLEAWGDGCAGYLESAAKLSLGQVLRIQVLRWAFAQLFDMINPATEFKLKGATGVEDIYSLRIFRRSPGGLLAWSRYVAAPGLKAKMSHVAGRK